MLFTAYELCPICRKPLINRRNLQKVRFRIAFYRCVSWFIGDLEMMGIFSFPTFGFTFAREKIIYIAACDRVPLDWAISVMTICRWFSIYYLYKFLHGKVGSVNGGTGALGLLHRNRNFINWCGCLLADIEEANAFIANNAEVNIQDANANANIEGALIEFY